MSPQAVNGFVVSRRCDNCGIKVQVVRADGCSCMCQCERCGREYEFKTRD